MNNPNHNPYAPPQAEVADMAVIGSLVLAVVVGVVIGVVSRV